MNKIVLRSNKGITLVSLVVTIVILIILVSIPVGLSIKDGDGIVSKVEEAKQNELDSQEETQIKINEINQDSTYEGVGVLPVQHNITINSINITDISEKGFTINLDVSGEIEKIEYKIDNGDYQSDPANERAKKYNFKAEIENGKEYSVSVKVTNGSYKKEETKTFIATF